MRIAGALLAALLVLAACVTAGGGSHWARDRSDLPHDPEVRLGVLDNGMRYVMRRNASPPGQVALRLVVHAGSMHETPGTEGAAHFLEHMLFRGTRRFPDGAVQWQLQNLGATLGVDANATTSNDVSIYKINLPRNDSAAVLIGLQILRDMAGEARLDAGLLEVERGVVLAEERARHSPESSRDSAELRSRVGDHPYTRPPIGSREAIEAMDVDALRSFYHMWYRPERSTLVIVGDFAPADVEPVLRKVFGSWRGLGPAGVDPPPFVPPDGPPRIDVHVIPGLMDAELQLVWPSVHEPDAPTRAAHRQRLVDHYGAQIVASRIADGLELADWPARSATGPQVSRIENVWTGAIARASGVTDVGRTLDVLVEAVRQAAVYGVTQDELDRVRSPRPSRQASRPARGPGGASAALAEAIARSMLADPVFISPGDNNRVTQEMSATITVEDVNAALQQRAGRPPHLLYLADAAPAAIEADLRDAIAVAWSAPLAPYQSPVVKPWPYQTFGPPGQVAHRHDETDIGVTFVTFENGVTLSVKPTRFHREELRVRVRVGQGRLGFPVTGPDASEMAVGLWHTGGVGKLSLSEQRRTLDGKFAVVETGLSEDAFELSTVDGLTIASDLPLQLELMAALVADPGLRASRWSQLLADADRAEANVNTTPAGVLSVQMPSLLRNGDARWTLGSRDMRRAWSPEDAAAFMRGVLASGPADIVIVGDIDVETAIAETGRTFGALPAREGSSDPADLKPVAFPQGASAPVVLRHGGRRDQGVVAIAWPVLREASFSSRDERLAVVLADILRDRATLHFRSAEGATYSPMSVAQVSRGASGHGYIQIDIDLPPERMDDAMAQIERIAAELASQVVSDDELNRTLGPRLSVLRRDMEGSNGWWLNQLSGAHRDRARLEGLRSGVSDYQSITARDVADAARRWLRPETALRVKVVSSTE